MAADGVEVAVRTVLVEDPDVAALVGSRVYQLRLPQGATLPAVRLLIVDELVPAHLRGVDALKPARVQVDCYGAEAAGYMPVDALARAVDEALLAQPPRPVPTAGLVLLGVQRDAREAIDEPSDIRTIRMLLEYRIWSSPL